jgi:hypothetical protein
VVSATYVGTTGAQTNQPPPTAVGRLKVLPQVGLVPSLLFLLLKLHCGQVVVVDFGVAAVGHGYLYRSTVVQRLTFGRHFSPKMYLA